MGWGDLALGGLDIVEMPINPHAMLVEPFVQTLAHELRVRLEPEAANPAIPGVTRVREEKAGMPVSI